MGRLIDADEYEKRIKPYDTEDVMDKALYNFAHDKLVTTPSAKSEPQWIPFQTRPLDEEEKEKFPDWDSILCGNLPDDGQKILVSIKYGEREYVINDEFYYSGYGECYLDSGYDFVTEAVAWMPLPEPWKGDKK